MELWTTNSIRIIVERTARIQKEVDMGTTGNVAPADDAQEGETPPEDEDAK